MCENTVSDRSKVFIESLYKEKEIHKEHRHKHVIQKLLLTSSFFGLGQLVKENCFVHLLLYTVPLIAVVHDIYIFAEHNKIRSVGDFIKSLGEKPDSAVCAEEVEWEKFSEKNREKQAIIGSLVYTLIISSFSAMAIYKLDPSVLNDALFSVWAVIVALTVIVVFVNGYFAITIKPK